MTHEEMRAKLDEAQNIMDMVCAVLYSKDVDLTMCRLGLSRSMNDAYGLIVEVDEAIGEATEQPTAKKGC